MDCPCRKNNCILKNDATYRRYFDKEELMFKTGHTKGCVCCSDFKEYREIMIQVEPVNLNVNPTQSKCRIIKHLITRTNKIRELSKVNRSMFSRFEAVQQAYDTETVRNLKLKELLYTLLAEKKKMIEERSLLKEQKKELRRENTRLKKLNKKMILTIAQDEYVDNDNDDDLDVYDCIEELPGAKSQTDDFDLSILLKYETLKAYMNKQNVGLGHICSRNDINESEKVRIYKAFVTKKLNRIAIAHPVVEQEILNDKEFLEYVLK